uniref:Carboxypeptidase n=1 Tax=Chlamydomonas euryale TaxID=1486919 RepID=A0A7R9YTY5_9CHLO|mmetsp:Transcript_20226/g.60052  ORF Transcript_20226/g.60052 Transcript_20226/m.60052 type:complete len:521 (+) Transcript_20226:88-1650(+)
MWRAGPSGLAAATVALLIPALSHAATAWRSGLAEGASIHAPRQSGRGRLTEYTPEAEADRVLSLPGWGDLDHFSVFAGYITVDEAAGRALFYVYVESERSPEDDPLVLWLNGGPGCSSLGGGFLSELGPFYPKADGVTLQKNPLAWNRVANMLFLESPAFVGFSYSNTSADRVVGDARTARDARLFLLGFIERFPHLRSNDLYLSGESYAGHYVPGLALEIVRANAKAADRNGVLDLQGFLVGNAWTDTAIDNEGAVDFWWAHALISDETNQGLKETCDFSKIGPLKQAGQSETANDCDDFIDAAMRELTGINIYEIYADLCLPESALAMVHAFSDAMKPAGALGLSARALTARYRTTRAGALESEEPEYDPCIDYEVGTYLNLPEVQKALHANQTVKLPHKWSDCSREIEYNMDDLLSSMLPVYKELLENAGLRILVFSGDVDGIVPVVGSRRWTAGLGLTTTRPWQPWLSATQQVGGYIVEYEGLSFATVRNAGHMVPYVQPERMYHLFSAFLAGGRP